MKATTLITAFDFTHAPPRRLLIACFLVAAAACGAFSTRARIGASGPEPPRALTAAAFQTPTPTPLPTATWRQPTKPNTTYVCDWKRPGASGMARLSFEYTRQTPGNGWIGKLNTTYPDGKRREDKTQFFAPKVAPRLGTEWSFQTTDGKIRCKFGVSRLGSEVKFTGCSNGVEQYCVDERVITTFEGLPDAGCAECRAGNVFDKMSCLARCFSRGGSGGLNSGLCEGAPVQCASLYFARNVLVIGWQDRFTRAGLSDLHQGWVDFVNGALGRCDSNALLCPAGTSCGSRGDCELRCRDYGGGVTDECPTGFTCGGRGTCQKKCTSSATCPDGSFCGAGGTCEKRSN
ncbi:MAG: hypothetical protein LC795_01610 [Acidobacteria bacterium]|nr:hypothetical protein [Acidobacteriota bacterium]